MAKGVGCSLTYKTKKNYVNINTDSPLEREGDIGKIWCFKM